VNRTLSALCTSGKLWVDPEFAATEASLYSGHPNPAKLGAAPGKAFHIGLSRFEGRRTDAAMERDSPCDPRPS